jgi:hypothetical protein
MVLQKLKLHEWFLVYQLDHLKKHGHHLPTTMQLDISRYADFYESRNQKLPLTALVLKIIGTWAHQNPEAHKMLFRTWGGFKFLRGNEIRINFPIEIKHNGQSVVTAIVIKNPHLKSIPELTSEIKEAKMRSLDSFPITKFAYSRANVFFNRWLLKGLHTLVNYWPSFYWNKGGGCISISSLSNLSDPNCIFSTYSFGPTGFTFFYKDVVQEKNKTYLNLSIGIDHNCYSGIELIKLVNQLMNSTISDEQNIFNKITQDVHA